MLKIFNFDSSQVFSDNKYSSILFKNKTDDDNSLHEGFSRVGKENRKFCNLSHINWYTINSIYFLNYLEYSCVFVKGNGTWEWVCENIVFGKEWRRFIN